MESSRTEAQERAGRIRAARDYAGVSFEDLAAKAGISVDTLKKAASPSAPRTTPLDDESLRKIAAATGVPVWFLRDGWAGAIELDLLLDPWFNGDDLRPVIRDSLHALVHRRADQRFDLEDMELIEQVRALDFEAGRFSASDESQATQRDELEQAG